MRTKLAVATALAGSLAVTTFIWASAQATPAPLPTQAPSGMVTLVGQAAAAVVVAAVAAATAAAVVDTQPVVAAAATAAGMVATAAGMAATAAGIPVQWRVVALVVMRPEWVVVTTVAAPIVVRDRTPAATSIAPDRAAIVAGTQSATTAATGSTTAASRSGTMIVATTLTTVVVIGSLETAFGSGSMVPITTPMVMTAGGCSGRLASLGAPIGGAAITTASAITDAQY